MKTDQLYRVKSSQHPTPSGDFLRYKNELLSKFHRITPEKGQYQQRKS